MTLLQQANNAFRQKNYEAAIGYYIHALQKSPGLFPLIQNNLKLVQDRYLKSRQNSKPRVCVCGWNLAQNAAGRAATLAQLYQPLAEVSIIGCYFKKWGFETWLPLRNFPVPLYGIKVEDEGQFVAQALEFVLQHPCDLLHLSKPRLPNIIIGALYKLIWNAYVIMDVDDEELAFVNASEPLALETYLKTAPYPVRLVSLTDETFTRLAVGLAKDFDGVTTVNSALQQRYGGEIVRHARDELYFKPSVEQRQKSREKYGIPLTEKVILFLGTPRQHKGILETAQAIAALNRTDVLFLIVGDFPAPLQNLKTEIEAIPQLKTRFLGNQPFENIPEILNLGDLCVLLQDPEHLAAQFQTPAKLTDALAMGIPVLAEKTAGLEDLAAKNAFTVVTRATLIPALEHALQQVTPDQQSHPVYREFLTLDVNRKPLQNYLNKAKQRKSGDSPLSLSLRKLLKHLPLDQALAQIGEPVTATVTAALPSLHLGLDSPNIDTIIQKAIEAMRQDDWSGAYECWKSLLSHPQDALSTDLLLRTSRELFKLDAFTEAATALKLAAAKDPNHPGVICEQAQQYYYHCYSSWLMLVTEDEPDWYKADGLDQRPDWQTACSLIEKAEKVAPRNNLRRYVQAYLLLAEDAWNKQNRKEAHAALRTALSAIGPKKLNKELTEAIFQAVDQFRDGTVDETDSCQQSIQDQLKALPLELLPVQDWLCLNDILNWNGMLLCGYVAREKAVDLAIIQGKQSPNNKTILKTALKAALDRNDTVQADEFLTKLKQINPNALDVQELDSCCELIKGNLKAFREKWPHQPTPADQRFRDYLKGKTVAVVGPAPTDSADGEEIDSHDVVVRVNWRSQEKISTFKEFGHRTDISLFNAHTVRYLRKKEKNDIYSKFEFTLVRRPNYNIGCKNKSIGDFLWIKEYPGCFTKSLNSIPAIIVSILLCQPKKIKLFKTSLYTGEMHAAGYRGNEKSTKNSVWCELQPVYANHDFLVQKKLISILFFKNLLDADVCLEKVISKGNDIYLQDLRGKYFSKNKINSQLGKSKETIDSLIAEAQKIMSRREWLKAIDLWKFVFNAYSNLPIAAYIGYSRSLRSLGDFELAENIVLRGIINHEKELKLYKEYALIAKDSKKWCDLIFRSRLLQDKSSTTKNLSYRNSLNIDAIRDMAISYGHLDKIEECKEYIDRYFSLIGIDKFIHSANKNSYSYKNSEKKKKILCLFDDDSSMFVASDFAKQIRGFDVEVTLGLITHSGSSRLSERQISSTADEWNIESFDIDEITKNAHLNMRLLDYSALIVTKMFSFSEEFYLKESRPKIVSLYPGLDFFPVTGILNRIMADLICFGRHDEMVLFDKIIPENIRKTKDVIVYSPKFNQIGNRIAIDAKKTIKNIYFLAQAIVPSREFQRNYILKTLNMLAEKNPDKNIIIKLRHLENENSAHSHPEKYAYHVLAKNIAMKQNITFSVEPMSEVLEKADFCITCSSTAGVECVLGGIPTLFWLDYPDSEYDPLTEMSRKLLQESGLICGESSILSLEIRKPNEYWEKSFRPEKGIVQKLINII